MIGVLGGTTSGGGRDPDRRQSAPSQTPTIGSIEVYHCIGHPYNGLRTGELQ